MKINRNELIDILKAVKPGLANKEVIEQSTHLIFQNNKLVTYNNEIMVSHPVELEIEGAVEADQLYSLLNKSKDEEINLSVEKESLLIRGKKFKAGLRIAPEIILPFKDITIPRRWNKLPEKFIEALKFCSFSADTDISKPVLTCLHLHDYNIESCDNQRLTRYGVSDYAAPDSLLIPVRAISDLINYPITEYAYNDSWAHFKTKDKVVFSCRILKDEYPDLSEFIRMRGNKIIFPDLIESLERAEIFTNTEITKERLVELILESNSLLVKSEGDKGWYEEKYRMKYTGKKVQFKINAQFLKEILIYLKEAIITNDRLKFVGDNFVHILTLVKN
jgi:DNA polymerase III sliding clamp (beta) subunit (PCNA family)